MKLSNIVHHKLNTGYNKTFNADNDCQKILTENTLGLVNNS